MKRIIYLAFVLVVILATSAGAQSLANLAKKEKERRVENKANGKTTATPVIKEEQLAEAKGENLSVTGTAAMAAPVSSAASMPCKINSSVTSGLAPS